MVSIICPQCRKQMKKVDVYQPRNWMNTSQTEYVCPNPDCPVESVLVERK
jgi:hypothetical protein